MSASPRPSTLAQSPYDLLVDSPVGRLGLRVTAGRLSATDFLYAGSASAREAADPVALRAARHLEAYFAQPRSGFTLPLALSGTDFQRRVWQALQGIGSGQTMTYGELARRLGTGARAVGGACRANPVPIVVPCHRVVASGGPGGFGGALDGPALGTKHWLLAHERPG